MKKAIRITYLVGLVFLATTCNKVKKAPTLKMLTASSLKRHNNLQVPRSRRDSLDSSSSASSNETTNKLKDCKLSKPLVLIAGNSKYKTSPNLKGVEIDVKKLYRLFTYSYGYSTVVLDQGFDFNRLKKFLAHYLSEDYHSGKNHDALIFMLLGHGGEGTFVFSDETCVPIDTIWNFFKANNQKLPLDLMKRPRLLFNIACRGNKNFNITKNPRKAFNSGNQASVSSPIFYNNDYNMSIVYANALGFVVGDTNNGKPGSWFVDKLARVLKSESLRKENLDSIIGNVRERILKETGQKECVTMGEGTLSSSKLYLEKSMLYWNVIKPVKDRYGRGVNELKEVDLGEILGGKHVLTPLQEAVARGDWSWVAKLCQHSDFNFIASRINLISAYYLALERKDTRVMETMLTNNPKKRQEKDWYNPSGLLNKKARRSLEEIKSKCPRGISQKESNDWRGFTALTKAACLGDTKLVKNILEIDPEAIKATVGRESDWAGKTALHIAAELGKKEVVKVILKRCPEAIKATVGPESDWAGYTALHIAADKGYKEVVEVILKRCPEAIKATVGPESDWAGSTALHIAANKGYKEVVEVILKRCPDAIKATVGPESDWAGVTALHIAAELGEKEVVDVILKRCPEAIKATVESGQRAGKTALHIAAEEGEKEVVEVCIVLKKPYRLNN